MSDERDRAMVEEIVGLADGLVADYDVIEVLGRLVRTCAGRLGIDAAAVLLADERGALDAVAASSDPARSVQRRELDDDAGPGLDCYRSGAPLTCTDLPAETLGSGGGRWPGFLAAARRAGFGSVQALPLRLRADTIGALTLLGHPTGALPAAELRWARALADVVTIAILSERAIRAAGVRAAQLQGALNSRVTIEQAKGLLAGRARIGMDQAFHRLRAHARARNLPLARLAHDVVADDAVLIDLLDPLPGGPDPP